MDQEPGGVCMPCNGSFGAGAEAEAGVENQMVFSHLCESLQGKEVPLKRSSSDLYLRSGENRLLDADGADVRRYEWKKRNSK